jgi:hypothetical protein
VQRRAGSNPAVPQLGEVERFVPVAENELRDAASGCRSVHDAVAGEARREDQVFDLVMGTDDAVVIEGVDLVVARLRPFEPQLFEGRDPVRERRPDRFLEQFMLGLVVALGVRIAVRGRRDAAYETGALRPNPGACRVE